MYFSKSDRRSIIALAFLAVVCVATLLIMNAYEAENKGKSEDNIAQADSTALGTDSTGQPNLAYTMAEFDPNTVDSATLVSFGINSKTARTFIRYRNAGAVFRTPEDIRRVYSLTDEDAERLLPYVRIGEKYAHKKRRSSNTQLAQHTYRNSPSSLSSSDAGKDSTPNGTPYTYPKKFEQLTIVDPNTADTTTLQRIPGIGRWIAKGIVEQRKRLGGYHSVEQLLEVRHFSPELLEWFSIDTVTIAIKKIDINKASFQQLNQHPYITYEQTRSLLHYIRLYGAIPDTTALHRTGIFSSDEIKRLAPYIEFILR